MKDLISVIIPAYNCENTIERCMDSVCGQTYTNIEIVIINDGSTDQTENICREYGKKDSRILFMNESNGGVSYARNNGIKISNGTYLMFVDADDYIDKCMLEQLLARIKEKDADLLVCDFYMQSEKGTVKKVEIYGDTEIDCSSNYDKERLILKGGGYVCNKLFKRDILSCLEKPLFHEDIAMCEDLLFFFRIVHNCKKVIYVKDAYYYYMYNAESACRRNVTKKTLTFVKAYRKIEEIGQNYANNALNDFAYMYLNNIINYVHIILCDKCLNKKEKKNYLAMLQLEYKDILNKYSIVKKQKIYFAVWKVNPYLADMVRNIRVIIRKR